MAKINFDATAIEPATAFDVIPKGEYLAAAVSSEMKATKSMTGQYLQLSFEILEGKFKGRRVFERLNIQNENKTAEEIAQRTLSALCHALGIMQLHESEQLHDIPVLISLVVEEGKGDYGPSNRITGYASASGGAPAAPAPVHIPPPKTNGGAAPWARK